MSTKYPENPALAAARAARQDAVLGKPIRDSSGRVATWRERIESGDYVSKYVSDSGDHLLVRADRDSMHSAPRLVWDWAQLPVAEP